MTSINPIEMPRSFKLLIKPNKTVPSVKLNIQDPPGTKCLGFETKVVMSDGSIKDIENINVNESLMGPDNQPRRVLSVKHASDNLYQISMHTWDSFTCNGAYMLKLTGHEPFIGRTQLYKNGTRGYTAWFSNKGIRKSKNFSSQIEAETFLKFLPKDDFNLSVSEYLQRKSLHQEHCYYYDHCGLEFPDREIPMDPYMIGYWLGDGTTSGAEISTEDQEIVDYFVKQAPKYGLLITKCQCPYHYAISSLGKRSGEYGCNSFLNSLRDLNILNNKHIPDLYLKNSREIRLQVLAGLIDSDGYQQDDAVRISQKSIVLSEGIEYLTRSLGFRITRKEGTGTWKDKNGDKKTGTYQYMYISGENLCEIPVKLERKKCTMRASDKRLGHFNINVTPIGNCPCVKFILDGDGQYMHEDFSCH